MIRKKLIAGNWKMNKTSSDAQTLSKEIVAAIGKVIDVEIVVCPPFTALETVGKVVDGSSVKLGAQNMHPEASGAYTGEISAPMLRAIFATHVILGHSERRAYFGETDAFINKKVIVALKNQLKPILCVGETLAEREAGTTLKVVQTQLEAGLEGVSKELAVNLVVAYEPVWAIGTGPVATVEQVKEVHAFVAEELKAILGAAAAEVPIQYGGSVTPDNFAELIRVPHVSGGLVGGAALVPEKFLKLVSQAQEA